LEEIGRDWEKRLGEEIGRVGRDPICPRGKEEKIGDSLDRGNVRIRIMTGWE
jgi:hypothetical protein